jgi:hypothetical protein
MLSRVLIIHIHLGPTALAKKLATQLDYLISQLKIQVSPINVCGQHMESQAVNNNNNDDMNTVFLRICELWRAGHTHELTNLFFQHMLVTGGYMSNVANNKWPDRVYDILKAYETRTPQNHDETMLGLGLGYPADLTSQCMLQTKIARAINMKICALLALSDTMRCTCKLVANQDPLDCMMLFSTEEFDTPRKTRRTEMEKRISAALSCAADGFVNRLDLKHLTHNVFVQTRTESSWGPRWRSSMQYQDCARMEGHSVSSVRRECPNDPPNPDRSVCPLDHDCSCNNLGVFCANKFTPTLG